MPRILETPGRALRSHGGRHTEPVTDPIQGGTNRAYTLARLKRDRPDLAEQVEREEISANKAAILAGFRKPRIAIPDDIEEAAAALIRSWGSDRAKRLGRLLLRKA